MPDESDAGEKPAVFVRPVGYVADEPVIRRLGARNVFIGNELAAHPDRHDHAFEHVLSVSTETPPAHHAPLPPHRRRG